MNLPKSHRRSRLTWCLAAALALLVGMGVRAAIAEEAAPAAKAEPGPNAAKPAPEKARQPRPIPDDMELLRDVEYGKGGQTSLKLDILRLKKTPDQPMPVVAWIHGGAWSAGSKSQMPPQCQTLVRQGFLCVSVEYRFSQEAIFPAQIEDCKCAIRYLRAHAKEYRIDPDHIGVWGGSAGGHLVALLGVTASAKDLEGKGGWENESSRVQAVVDFFGPADFVVLAKDPNAPQGGMGSPVAKLLGGKPSEKPELAAQASPITYVSKDAAPILICHGDKDPTVPLVQSETFYEALKKAGVDATLYVVKDAGHGFNSPEVNTVVIEFFQKHLKGAAPAAK